MVVHKRVAKALSKRKPKKLPAKLLPGIARPRPPSKFTKAPPPQAIPWWIVPMITSVYHYGRHEEVRNWWERRGEDWREWRDPAVPTEIDPESPWMLPEGYAYETPMMPGVAPPRAPTKIKRKISKANRAMKMSYDFYRRKFKGKMTQKKCREIMRKASKMAGKANPHTRSRIGKGGDWIKRHCRKVRKGIWNTTKRTYGR